MKIPFAAVVVAGGLAVPPPGRGGLFLLRPRRIPVSPSTRLMPVFVGRVTHVDRGSSEPSSPCPTVARFDVVEVLRGTVPDVVELRAVEAAHPASLAFRRIVTTSCMRAPAKACWRPGCAAGG